MRETLTQAPDARARALLRTTSDHSNGSPELGIEVVHVSVCSRRSGDGWANRNHMGNMRDGLHVYDIFGCDIVGPAPFSAIDLPDLTNTIACSTSRADVG